MMDEFSSTVAIAAITLSGTILAPLLLIWMTARTRRQDQRIEWERQDAVAAAVAEVAALAKIANEQTSTQLTAIHTLVNSDMTAARSAELVATLSLLVLLKRLRKPSAEDMDAITIAEARAAVLRQILAERAAQQAVLDQQHVGSAPPAVIDLTLP